MHVCVCVLVRVFADDTSCSAARYMLEVPDKATKAVDRNTECEYELKSRRSGYRRYWTADIKAMLEELTKVRELKYSAVGHTR